MSHLPQPTVQCVADGFDFEARSGQTLMLALKDTGFDIEASCEGSLVCGTCHVRLLAGWDARLPAARADEREMLDSLQGVTPNSRLACQIVLSPELNGLAVEIAR